MFLCSYEAHNIGDSAVVKVVEYKNSVWHSEHKDKRIAVVARDVLRKKGVVASVFRVSGTYTQPGVGIVAFTRYEVRIAKEAV